MVRLSRRFRNSIALGTGQDITDSRRQVDFMPHRYEDRICFIFRPHDGADHFTGMAHQGSPTPSVERGLPVFSKKT